MRRHFAPGSPVVSPSLALTLVQTLFMLLSFLSASFPASLLFLRTDLGVLAAAAGIAGVFSFLHRMKRRRADTKAQQHHVSGILPATAPSGTLQIAKHSGRGTDTFARPPMLQPPHAQQCTHLTRCTITLPALPSLPSCAMCAWASVQEQTRSHRRRMCQSRPRGTLCGLV